MRLDAFYQFGCLSSSADAETRFNGVACRCGWVGGGGRRFCLCVAEDISFHFGSEDEAESAVYEGEGKQASKLIAANQPKFVERNRLQASMENAEGVFARIIIAGVFKAYRTDVLHARGLRRQKKFSLLGWEGGGSLFVERLRCRSDISAKDLLVPLVRIREDEAPQKCTGAGTFVFLLSLNNVADEVLQTGGGVRVVEGWGRRYGWR